MTIKIKPVAPLRIKYKRAPHSGRCYLVNIFSDRAKQGFSPIEWDKYLKRMKESFPDVEFEEVPIEASTQGSTDETP